MADEYPAHLLASYLDMGSRQPCRFCGQEIVRGRTQRGNWARFDPDTMVNHWATCSEREAARAAYLKERRK